MTRERGSRTAVQAGLAVYLVALGVMLLVPWGEVPSRILGEAASVASRAGVPPALLVPTRFEFIANVLVVIPASTAASWLWPRHKWTEWTAYAFAISLGVEAVQAVALAGRSATFSDVVANTAGGLLGGVFAVAIRHLRLTGRRPHHPSQRTTR